MIIQGAMGAGKSNLLNAITWCLYKEEIHLSDKERSLPVPNAGVVAAANRGQAIPVSVELHIEDDDGTQFLIRRNANFHKAESGKVTSFDSSGELSVRYLEAGKSDWKVAQDADFIVNSRIPGKIKEYFFFDGERLNDYFRKESNSQIKEAVYDIAQIKLLETALRHLGSMRTVLARSEGEESSQIGQLSSEIELLRQSLEHAESETRDMKKQRESLEAEDQKLAELLRQSPSALVRELQARRDALDKTLSGLDGEIRDLEMRRSDTVISSAPMILAYPALIKSLDLVGKSREAGRIPPQYTRIFIDRLLHTRVCICGSKLEPGSVPRKRVEEVKRDADEISEIVGEITDAHGHFLAFKDRLEGFSERQFDMNKRLGRLKDEYEERAKELKQVSERITGINVEEIQFSENRRNEITKRLMSLASQISVRERDMDLTRSLVEKKTTELNRAIDAETKYKELRRKMRVLERAEKMCERIRDHIVGQVRKQVEESTRKHFLELTWKKTTFKTINITEDYGVSVTHETGYEAIGSLSAGERQILALGFMAALNEVSGFNAPIVIDTPLGRISDEPTESIAQNLPSYMPDRQVIMLVTDKEYSEKVRTKLAPAVHKEFVIRVRTSGGSTTSEVVPYESN